MSKHIHILGICGTFMGGLAVLARQMGYRVTGCDANVYPPMSTYLASQGIEIIQGFDADQLYLRADEYVVGNAMKRGMPILEAILNQQLPYISGPQWLADNLLHHRQVVAIAGTHGKTTTSSLVAHILQKAGRDPGFLIGGIPENFGVSSQLGSSEIFVIEADEYDCAFSDKRSKFVHYRPRYLIANNLEFDHGDIFDTVADIQKQFHHLIRTLPQEGLIVHNEAYPFLQEAIQKGCWTPLQSFGKPTSDWHYQIVQPDGTEFKVAYRGQAPMLIKSPLLGEHNVQNIVAAIAITSALNVSPADIQGAMLTFKGVKRRLELRGVVNQVSVYDDFAHHPTAVETTLKGLKHHVKSGRVLAILEARSNTMRMGHHGTHLRDALEIADSVLMYQPKELTWSANEMLQGLSKPFMVGSTVDELVAEACKQAKVGDHIVIMSNGGFAGIHERLLSALGR